MIPSVLALVGALRSLFRSRAALHVEVLALRHQLLVLDRQRAGKPVRLQRSDRLLWSWLSRCWPGWRRALVMVQPETVLRWHRRGFRLYWRWKSCSRRPGRPRIAAEVRALVLEMHRANPTWGRASDSRGAPQARHPDRAIDGLQIPAAGSKGPLRAPAVQSREPASRPRVSSTTGRDPRPYAD